MGNRENSKSEKVTIGHFFKAQWAIIQEMFSKFRIQSVAIILLSLLALSTNFIELKFLEYMTNEVSNDHLLVCNGTSSWLTVIMFLGSLFVLRVTACVYNRLHIKYQSNIVFEAEKKYLKKMSILPYEFFESANYYKKIDLADQANSQYGNAIYGITQLFGIVISTLVYGILLSKVSFLFVIVILFFFVISVVSASFVTDKQMDYWRNHVSPETRKNNYFKGVLANRINHQNIQNTQSFGYFSDLYSFYNKRERSNYLKLNLISFFTEFGSLLIFVATFAFVTIFVGNRVITGEYEIGFFSMVMALLLNFFATIKSFTMFMINGNWYVKVLDAYYEILEVGDNKPQILSGAPDCISFDMVSYIYNQSKEYALKDISVSFRRGEKIAIVGYNGSGKSTAVSLVLGLLKCSDGALSIGKNVKCAAVFQDFVKYQLTIKENIEIGCGGNQLPEEAINSVLEKVGLLEFVSSLPAGIYTNLGQLEDGIELSQGQWQRIAIARLLVNNEANVWILDEPTAYLDPLAEIDIYKLIYKLSENKLVFFISHRLGFAKMADRIIVLNKGQIIEQGNHSDLMNIEDGVYCKMYNTQKSWYDE